MEILHETKDACKSAWGNPSERLSREGIGEITLHRKTKDTLTAD